MSKQKSVLVATIGTRDIAFCSTSGEWLNIGNAFTTIDNDISEQLQVQIELGIDNSNFRSITKYLSDNWQEYQERLKPIIIGQMLQDYAKEIKQIYLIGTDQHETVKQRDRDTIHSTQIIQQWIAKNYQIPTKIILQGSEGGNPADFEQMFRWWKETWRTEIIPDIKEGTKFLLCLKGGVGSFSEAARISALSRFGEDSQFFDFIQDSDRNRRGESSAYTPPTKGTNYLWDRQQQEALALLNRYDYQGVRRVLRPYYRNVDSAEANSQLILQIESSLAAAVAWNQANFEEFAKLRSQSGVAKQWWWTGYEAAYLGLIRYHQDNTVEALFHSFRAVEGMMSDWAISTYPNDIVTANSSSGFGKVPLIKQSIARQQGLQRYANQFKGKPQIPLYGRDLDNLLQIAKPEYKQCRDIQKFWDVAKDNRNQVFHRLLGLDKGELFDAWGTFGFKEWQSRVLNCLNFVSGQHYNSLAEASLMSQVHQILIESISNYQPE